MAGAMCIKSFLKLCVRGNEEPAVLDITFLQPYFLGVFLEVFLYKGAANFRYK
jgi:hypothetical protein